MKSPTLFLDKDQIIQLAACHTCCAKRGEPCVFARVDDPHGRRMAARQSHRDRVIRARKIWDSALDTSTLIL